MSAVIALLVLGTITTVAQEEEAAPQVRPGGSPEMIQSYPSTGMIFADRITPK